MNQGCPSLHFAPHQSGTSGGSAGQEICTPRAFHHRVRWGEDRRGKAGSSGGPWLIHSEKVGDVLIGITHGGGYAPQVAYAANWIQESVRKHSNDQLLWATKNQTLGK